MMLSLPRGIRRSVEAHNSDRPVFYDWLEANTLFVEEELSQTDVVDFLMEQQIYARQDFCSEFVSNAWIQIERRLKWIGRGSPLGFRDRLMIREIDWQATPGQSLLVASTLVAEAWLEEPPTTYVSFFACCYMAQQTSIWQRLWERLKLLVMIAVGKEYQLQDMVIVGIEDHKALADFFRKQTKRSREWEHKVKEGQLST